MRLRWKWVWKLQKFEWSRSSRVDYLSLVECWMGTMKTDLVFGDFNGFPNVQEICDLTSKDFPHLNLNFEYLFRRAAGVRKSLRREGRSDREERFSELLLQRGYRVGFSRSCLYSESRQFSCASIGPKDVMYELDHKPECSRLHRSIQFRVTVLNRNKRRDGAKYYS